MAGSRGKPKPSLRDLGKAIPTTEEFNALTDEIGDAHPIATAIIGTAMIEHELDMLLRRRIGRNDSATWDQLLSDNGPLGTLSRKIWMGFALRIYDADTKANLDIVRNVRNAFAHSRILVDFNNPLIDAELKKIRVHKEWKKYQREHFVGWKLRGGNNKIMFGMLCVALSISLLRRHTSMVRRTNRPKPSRTTGMQPTPKELKAQSRYVGTMSGLIGAFPAPPPGDGPTSLLQLYQQSQSVGPTPPTPTGSVPTSPSKPDTKPRISDNR